MLVEYLWFAPEVLRGKCKVSQPADIYSYSMIMFEILTRMAPFEMDQDLLTAKRKLYTMYIVLPFCMYQKLNERNAHSQT
jgi:serine/threonine protein kinase